MLTLVRSAGDRLARIPRVAGALLAVSWGAFVWWLSSGPPPDVPAAWRFAYVFNLAHAPLFGFLALFTVLALPRAPASSPVRPRWPILGRGVQALVMAAIFAYAAIDEWHQASTPERTSTWRDIMTDLVGAAAVLAVVAYVARGDATPRGLWTRLAVGSAACCAAAWLATFA